jgi:hypothetical protein
MTHHPPITWIENPRARTIEHSEAVDEFFPPGISRERRAPSTAVFLAMPSARSKACLVWLLCLVWAAFGSKTNLFG